MTVPPTPATASPETPAALATPATPALGAKSAADRIKELRDWIDVIFKVVLAATGVIVGYYFSYQKQQNEDIKLVVDLATAPEPAKRLLSVSIAQNYAEQGRIPKDIFVSLFSYGNSGDDPKLRAAVNNAATAVAAAKPEVREALATATTNLPVRIYFHIRQLSDRPRALEVEKLIESSTLQSGGNALVVPGVQYVPGESKFSVLKCFRKIECETIGKALVALFEANNVAIELSDQSASYAQSTSIRPNHFEAWFADGLPPLAP